MKMSNDRLRFRRARAGNHRLAAGVRLRPTWRARWSGSQREPVALPLPLRGLCKARHMPIEGVALIPRCAECEAHWLPADEERWQAWLTDDGPPELAFYCPDCAEREFAG
jgi:hypothetical protein